MRAIHWFAGRSIHGITRAYATTIILRKAYRELESCLRGLRENDVDVVIVNAVDRAFAEVSESLSTMIDYLEE